jgi:hypothetical protein
MASAKESTRRPGAAARRYRHDPQRAGLARSFGAWAARQGLAEHALTEEQCIVLEAVRRFLAWSGSGTLFTRLAFLVLLHVGLRFPRRIVQAVLGRSITDKSAWRALAPRDAVARLRAPDRRVAAGAQRSRLTVAHVGPIARFLTAHPHTTVVELHRWITDGPLQIPITRRRLYPALRRLGLDTLLLPWGQRKKGALRTSTAPSTPAPSS